MVTDVVASAVGRNPNSSGSCRIAVVILKRMTRVRRRVLDSLAKEEACEGGRSAEGRICEPDGWSDAVSGSSSNDRLSVIGQ